MSLYPRRIAASAEDDIFMVRYLARYLRDHYRDYSFAVRLIPSDALPRRIHCVESAYICVYIINTHVRGQVHTRHTVHGCHDRACVLESCPVGQRGVHTLLAFIAQIN